MKILGVCFNYPTHRDEAQSLGLGVQSPPHAEPVFFHKGDSLLLPNTPFFLPDMGSSVEYEAELVVQISRVGKRIAERSAHRQCPRRRQQDASVECRRYEHREPEPHDKPRADDRRNGAHEHLRVLRARERSPDNGRGCGNAEYLLPRKPLCDDLLIDEPRRDGGRGECNERPSAV